MNNIRNSMVLNFSILHLPHYFPLNFMLILSISCLFGSVLMDFFVTQWSDRFVGNTVPPKISPFDFGEAPLNFGEPASVQCTILGGDLPMTTTFWHNNQSIDQMHDVSLSKIGKRIHVLSIESVAGHHAGVYSCRAKNIAGVSEHSAVLSVNGL